MFLGIKHLPLKGKYQYALADRGAIARVVNNLKIKQDYKDEKLELEARIDDLEAKIYRLSFRIGNIRKQALDAYSLLLNVPKDLICQEITEAISHIQNILEEE